MTRKHSIPARLMRALGTRHPHALWHRYALGFIVIFLTISASHWATVATITAAEDDARVLSVSSGQRMLSQRILFLMSETEHNRNPNVDQRLEAALNLFEMNHNWLVERPNLSPELQYLYFQSEPLALDAFSRRFVQLVSIASTSEGAQKDELTEIVATWGTEDLLVALKSAADLFRQQSEAHITRLQLIQKLSLTAALVVLFLEALFIFIPAQISVNQSFMRLERRKQHLRASLAKLKKRNAQLTDARQRLAHASDHDALTGLSNRRAVYEYLSGETLTPGDADGTIGVLKLDIDGFKEINETFGHATGDDLLKVVARVLRSNTSLHDVVGRIGGDEFIVLITDRPSPSLLDEISRHILHEIRKPTKLGAKIHEVSASIGYTMASTSTATPEQMLIEADLALYDVKRHRAGTAGAYSVEIGTEIVSHRSLCAEIKEAVLKDAFEAFVQPLIHTRTGTLYSCEVLARWRHPELGLLAPGRFISAAEDAQLIGAIDLAMIEKGLDFIERSLAAGHDVPAVSVNASPATLRDIHLNERLLQEVRARHLKPENLIVEVLESTLIEGDSDIALTNIESMTASGFRVVLDDFGTGYASMSNLSRLRLTGIKLDQSLVKPLPDPRAESIVSAMIALSRSLNMTLVAEGVETHAHLARIASLGCDVAQGYAVGRPMSVDAFADWQAERHAPRALLG